VTGPIPEQGPRRIAQERTWGNDGDRMPHDH
jgi:hypothetical protein